MLRKPFPNSLANVGGVSISGTLQQSERLRSSSRWLNGSFFAAVSTRTSCYCLTLADTAILIGSCTESRFQHLPDRSQLYA